jgi:hypothetical protein
MEGMTRPMMTDQPRRVTQAEICQFLDQLRSLPRDASVAERIGYHERKAQLLTRIAADLNTAEAHEVAARAWDQLGALAARLRREPGEGQ